MTDDRSLLERPYSERKLIVVVSDQIVEASREAERKALEQQQKKGIDWSRIGEIAISLALPGGMGAVGTAYAVTQIIEAWSRSRASGIDVIQVGTTESTSISFSPGHPRDGVLYIGHPAMTSVYYSMAEFHRVAFEHKVSEAVNLLMHLVPKQAWVLDLLGRDRGPTRGAV